MKNLFDINKDKYMVSIEVRLNGNGLKELVVQNMEKELTVNGYKDLVNAYAREFGNKYNVKPHVIADAFDKNDIAETLIMSYDLPDGFSTTIGIVAINFKRTLF